MGAGAGLMGWFVVVGWGEGLEMGRVLGLAILEWLSAGRAKLPYH
jgi:hypothetical protein